MRGFSISKTRFYFSFLSPPSVPLELGVNVAVARVSKTGKSHWPAADCLTCFLRVAFKVRVLWRHWAP